jgi:hypothetical protein
VLATVGREPRRVEARTEPVSILRGSLRSHLRMTVVFVASAATSVLPLIIGNRSLVTESCALE